MLRLRSTPTCGNRTVRVLRPWRRRGSEAGTGRDDASSVAGSSVWNYGAGSGPGIYKSKEFNILSKQDPELQRRMAEQRRRMMEYANKCVYMPALCMHCVCSILCVMFISVRLRVRVSGRVRRCVSRLNTRPITMSSDTETAESDQAA
jgi:hypothetical protein